MTQFLKEIRKSYTFRLRKQEPSFLDGLTSMVNFSRKITENYNTDETEEIADAKALESDWKAVGRDMYSALNKYEQKPRVI